MKFALTISWIAVVLSGTTTAGFFPRARTSNSDNHDSKRCEFTISSNIAPHPAGQLDDDIRLNGTEATAKFYIDNNGWITNSNGCGCLIADTTHTQFQCLNEKTPGPGFSIDGTQNIRYQGSSKFFACSASGTEYNIFVKPDARQGNCKEITLQASACGSAKGSGPPPASSSYSTSLPPASPLPSTCPSPSTIWQTQTVSQEITQTVTVLTTSAPVCTVKPQPVGAETPGLGKRSDAHLHQLAKRIDLAAEWRDMYNQKGTNWVAIQEIKSFDIALGTTQKFATALFYGCTIFVIVKREKVIIGHLAEVPTGPASQNLPCSLDTLQGTTEYLIAEHLDVADILDEDRGLLPPDGCNQIYAVIFGSVEDRANTGVPTFRNWFCGEGKIPTRNVRYHYYRREQTGAFVFEPENSSSNNGKSLIRWVSPSPGLGVLSVYLSSNTPLIEVTFNDDWDTFGNPIMGATSRTTDGAGNRVRA